MLLADLFCGTGGFSRGFVDDGGYLPPVAIDNDPTALEYYDINLPGFTYKIDLADNPLRAVCILRDFAPDVIIGSPPCQDYSPANMNRHRLVGPGRCSLTEWFAEISSAARPDVIVMENVVASRRTASFDAACITFRQRGYSLTTVTLEASLWDCPTKLRRLFTIATSRFSLLLGAEAFATYIERAQSENLVPITVRDVLPDIDTDHFFYTPRSYTRQAVFPVDGLAPTILCRNHPIPPVYRDPIFVPPESNSAGIDEARTLTTEELAVISGFPKQWHWPKAKYKAMRLLGNAVPPPLAKVIASGLRKFVFS